MKKITLIMAAVTIIAASSLMGLKNQKPEGPARAKVLNFTSDPLILYVDGKFGCRAPAKGSCVAKIKSGNHSFYFKRANEIINLGQGYCPPNEDSFFIMQ